MNVRAIGHPSKNIVLSECGDEATERYAIWRPFFAWLENVCRGTITDCQVGEDTVIADI